MCNSNNKVLFISIFDIIVDFSYFYIHMYFSSFIL